MNYALRWRKIWQGIKRGTPKRVDKRALFFALILLIITSIRVELKINRNANAQPSIPHQVRTFNAVIHNNRAYVQWSVAHEDSATAYAIYSTGHPGLRIYHGKIERSDSTTLDHYEFKTFAPPSIRSFEIVPIGHTRRVEAYDSGTYGISMERPILSLSKGRNKDSLRIDLALSRRQHVSIKLYDQSGQDLATITSGEMGPEATITRRLGFLERGRYYVLVEADGTLVSKELDIIPYDEKAEN